MKIMGEEEDTWPFVASIIYTTAWCVSFYGQIYENYKLKSYEVIHSALKVSLLTTLYLTSQAIRFTPSIPLWAILLISREQELLWLQTWCSFTTQL